MTIDLSYALQLPPERAIEYFRSKGYEFSWDWDEVWEDAQTRAFTIAKVMRADVLNTVRQMVERGLTEGITFQQFQQNLEPYLKLAGWWGRQQTGDGQEVQLGSPRRLKIIYRTNLQTAYMVGRYQEMIENREDRPYWQYVAVLDSRTRPDHRALDGRVFRYDDPFWLTHYPPNGFNCRCRVRALSQRDVESRGLAVERSTLSEENGRTFAEIRHDGQTYRIAPDRGWNYSPGRASLENWAQSRIETMPDQLRRYVEEELTRP